MDQTVNNTFPPLISQNSSDAYGRHHVYGPSAEASLAIISSNLDPFFSPDINFTGFASNGTHYTNGIQDTIVSGFSVDRINEGLSNNGIIASILLSDNRILFIEGHGSTNNTTGVINPYTNTLEYSDANLINNYPVEVDSSVVLSKNIYDTIVAFGGQDMSASAVLGTQIKVIIGFNPITNQWFNYNSVLPVDIRGFKVFPMMDGKFLIIGGFEGLTPVSTTASYIFDPLEDKLITIDAVVPRTDFILWHANDNELWIIGGQDTTTPSADTSTVYVYNLINNTVYLSTIKLPNSTGLYACKGHVYGDTMYIWGGKEVSTNNPSLYLYSITNGGISQRQPILNSRYGYTSYLDVDTIYVFSGFDSSNTLLDSVIAYSIPLNTETVIGSITARSYSNDVIKIDNRYFILGSYEGTKSTDVVTYLTTPKPIYASWYIENPSMYRGLKKEFPEHSVVLVNEDSFSILDQNDNFNVWMTSVSGVTLLFRKDPLGFGIPNVPYSIEYARGIISIIYKMIGMTGVYIVYIDFVNDRTYVEYNISGWVWNGFFEEMSWIMNQTIMPGETGTISFYPTTSTSITGTGTWTNTGFTPVQTSPFLSFSTTYSDAYTGTITGGTTNVVNTSLYRVDVYSKTDIEYLQGSSTLDVSGNWSVSGVLAGHKVAKLVRISDSVVIASTDFPGASINSGFMVELWIKTDILYYQATVAAKVDGTWTTGNFDLTSFPAGSYVARLVPDTGVPGSKTILASSRHKAVRSYSLPTSDPAYPYLSNRCYIYDQAIALISSLAYKTSHPELADQLADALIAMQDQVSSEWRFSVDTTSLVSADPLYRTGAHAWACYALLLYARLMPPSALVDSAKTAAQNGLNRLLLDKDNGLIKGGHGQYISGVFYDNPITWKSTEHNVDCYFALQAGSVVLGGTFGTEATALASNIVSQLWNSTNNRFDQGLGDTADALDINTWGGMFLIAVGENAKASASFSNAASFYVTTSTTKGYTPYLPDRGYPGAVPTPWSEGTFGYTLLAKKLGYNTASTLQGIFPNRGSDFGWAYCLNPDTTYDITTWENVAGTGWAIIASESSLNSVVLSNLV